jgi:type I protein arginine methyltransferase
MVLKRMQARLVWAVDRLIGFLVSIPALRRIAYASRNRQAFTSFYEHEKMLADSVRVDTYAKALEKHIRPGDVVVDVGTGTGILSFLAVRARPKIVHAIDHSDSIEMAEVLARSNGITGIELHKIHSRAFDPAEMADVIIHEQIGDLLFEERMVETLLDLRDRVLKPGGRIVPGRFSFYISPVQLNDDDAVPFGWEQTLHGVDFSVLRPRIGEGGVGTASAISTPRSSLSRSPSASPSSS